MCTQLEDIFTADFIDRASRYKRGFDRRVSAKWRPWQIGRPEHIRRDLADFVTLIHSTYKACFNSGQSEFTVSFDRLHKNALACMVGVSHPPARQGGTHGSVAS
jgi:hypothetical protein